MEIKSDLLFQILEEYLFAESDDNQTEEQIVFNTVADYIFQLFDQGFIPEFVLDDMEIFLKEEVRGMLKKRTYGYYSLQHFRRSLNVIASKNNQSDSVH